MLRRKIMLHRYVCYKWLILYCIVTDNIYVTVVRSMSIILSLSVASRFGNGRRQGTKASRKGYGAGRGRPGKQKNRLCSDALSFLANSNYSDVIIIFRRFMLDGCQDYRST